MRRSDPQPYWNTNVARHPGILRAVPEGCGGALDVGCGDGLLARKLAGRAKTVTGIDKSPEMIARARQLADAHRDLTFDVLRRARQPPAGRRSDGPRR
ncbi:class I SAM-dependent methyltransferase [Streptomyces hundungensis]|uniref:class I SAM-dependent methyltransferase n=1 Tax=Streptomyces hundungensis TaxID=1077946 RepID=UPI00338739A3